MFQRALSGGGGMPSNVNHTILADGVTTWDVGFAPKTVTAYFYDKNGVNADIISFYSTGNPNKSYQIYQGTWYTHDFGGSDSYAPIIGDISGNVVTVKNNSAWTCEMIAMG